MRRKANKPLLINLGWAAAFAVVLAAGYVFTYAPVFRVVRTENAVELPFYRPVDWLIDNTPLRPLLFYWADLWGVGDDFRFNHEWRTLP
jgi:hypothetical protein